jgi:hypothetical protein
MSRGDGAIVACHEMLGTTPPEKGRSRRVRCDGVSQLQEAVHHDEKHLWIGCARSYRTLRDGSFEGRFTRHFVPGYDRIAPPGQYMSFERLNF